VAALVAAAALSACTAEPAAPANGPGSGASQSVDDDASVVTLAFAGDVHFENHLALLLRRPELGLGLVNAPLSDADVTMVNLETAIAGRGPRDPKELERPTRRYWFRTSPTALDLLAAAGVDVVSVANNHGGDYGATGLEDTLRAADAAPLAVVGVGADRSAAFAPYRITVDGTALSFFAADASRREGSSSVWAAGPTNPGIAAARSARPRDLLAAVRAADERGDVVVVYLHWGREYDVCPSALQRSQARALADAGADVVVGAHAHVLQGAGWIGGTYVGYGLGNFVWYHNSQSATGVLRLTLEEGRVVSDDWVPARIRRTGVPSPVLGGVAARAVTDWERLRGCTGLASRPGRTGGGEDAAPSPTRGYAASIRPIGPGLAARMTASHRPGCPVALNRLRLLRMTYLGFDGRHHVGEMVVAAPYAEGVVEVFERLYDARWPIRRMRLVDAFGGDDDRSMAADNTSAYNCRRVAGSDRWSAHAYGAAIDLNPVENPYLTGDAVLPPSGRRFAGLDRSAEARVPRGVIRADDVVVRAFADIGWEWGGDWSSPDYQHFAARPVASGCVGVFESALKRERCQMFAPG
jgi:poly-gamma-glutamate synthesis protein (capsule biosynthesis protein)